MDFQTQEEIHTPKVYYDGEDDDVLYDELKRQVLQLTAEDDDVHYNAKKTEARKLGPFYDPYRYYDWPGIKEDCGGAPPSWMLNLWRSGGNGTGVFIPQTTTVHCSRRRNRSRKNKNDRGRVYKQVEKMN